MSDIELRMKYFGTVRLLCETYNKLQEANRDANAALCIPHAVDPEDEAVMEGVASDFNGIATHHEMVKCRDGKFAIFDKEKTDADRPMEHSKAGG